MKALDGSETHDDNLRPLNSPMTSDRPQIGMNFDDKSDRGMVRRFQLKALSIGSDDIADGAVTGAKIAVNAVSNTKISAFDWNKGTGGTISNAVISGGTINNSRLGTPNITGGTLGTVQLTGGTITSFIGTSQHTGGTFSGGVLGTNQLTGGTVNPGVYQIGGTVGASGTFSYLTAGTIAGSMVFSNGIFLGTL